MINQEEQAFILKWGWGYLDYSQ